MFAVLLGVAGYRYGASSQVWTAEGSVTVQDPQSEALGTAEAYDPKRHVSNQSEILESYQVAQVAASALAGHTPPFAVSAESLHKGLWTSTSGSADVIRVYFSNPDPDLAIAVVNEAITAYSTVQRQAAQTIYSSGLTQLDRAIADLETALADVSATLATQSAASANITEVETAIAAAVTELLALQLPGTATQARLALFNQQFTELKDRIENLRSSITTRLDAEIDETLVQRQADLNTRLIALKAERDELAVNSQIAGNGVAFVAEAVDASPSSMMMPAVGGTAAGALLGMALAFYLAARRRHFSSREEPEAVLGAGLTSDVPDFSDERLTTTIPVRDAPNSAAAESFRFVAGALTGHLSETEPGSGSRATVVAVVAPSHAEGTTTIAANTALAAANAGWRVALVDADFAAQTLTHLLGTTDASHFGLTDLATGDRSFESAGEQVPTQGEGLLMVYGRGHANPQRIGFFASAHAANAFEELRSNFDLVVVDTPPLLRVAAAGSVVRLSDLTLVPIRHRGNAVAAAELRDQMATLERPMVGYVYNRGPLRREMAATSKRDNLPPAMSSTNKTK